MRAKAFPIGTRAYECFATRQMGVGNMTLKIRAVEAKGNVLVCGRPLNCRLADNLFKISRIALDELSFPGRLSQHRTSFNRRFNVEEHPHSLIRATEILRTPRNPMSLPPKRAEGALWQQRRSFAVCVGDVQNLFRVELENLLPLRGY